MSVNGNIAAANMVWQTSLTATTTTRAKMLVDTTAGALALPDNASFPTNMAQVTRGGQRIIAGTITSTDTVAKDVLVYRGTVLTQQDATNTGALAVATTSTVTRVTGDFRADGWTVGDAMMIFGGGPLTASGVGAKGSPDYSVNGTTLTALGSVGVLGVVTAVAALTLTVNGTPLVVESLAGSRLVRVAQAFRQTIAIAAGNAAATPAVVLIGGSNDADMVALPAEWRGISLGPKDVMVVAAQATLSALPAQINFNALSILT